MTGTPVEDGLRDWLLGEAPLLVLEIGRDGVVVSTNAYSAALVGEPLEGVHFRRAIVDFNEALDPPALAREGSAPRRLGVSRTGGAPRDFRCSFRPLPETTLLIGVPDTSEEEAMSDQFLALNRDLGNLTRELQKANAELAQLHELKNQFLGMATHDLRKPLGLIMGFTELVQESAGDRLLDDEKQYLGKVLTWAEAMTKLVEDFLNVSVIESGGLQLASERVPLSTLIARVRTLAAIQADRKGVELRVVEDPGIPPLMLDPARMDQVLVNLLSNAIDFSHRGSWVELRTRMDGKRVVVEVEDRGVGMDDEDVKRLFAPFGKAKGQKTGGESSTGLGLVISKKIVEAHGGEISVSSRIGEGSVFRVSLPIEAPGARE